MKGFGIVAALAALLLAMVFAMPARAQGEIEALSGTLIFPQAGYQWREADRVERLVVEYAAQSPSWLIFSRGAKVFRLPISYAAQGEGQTVVAALGCWVHGDGTKERVEAHLLVWEAPDGLHASLRVGSSLYFKALRFYIPDTVVAGEWHCR